MYAKPGTSVPVDQDRGSAEAGDLDIGKELTPRMRDLRPRLGFVLNSARPPVESETLKRTPREEANKPEARTRLRLYLVARHTTIGHAPRPSIPFQYTICCEIRSRLLGPAQKSPELPVRIDSSHSLSRT